MWNILDQRLASERNNFDTHSKMAKPNLFDKLVDQYKLQRHLGQSGVSDVYLAYDVDENREVIVEILVPYLANNRTYAERFLAKMRQVAQIKHRHISQVLQVGIATLNNRPYFARKKIESFPLNTRIQQLKNQDTPVNSVYALKLVRQIAEGLALAEKLEIFHHDLQPEKIWIEPNGNVVIANLGVPRLKNFTNNGANVRQNPNYWSPEQIQGKPILAKSHVYSLGVILFELLTGTLPVTYDSLWQNIKQAVNPNSLASLRPDLSAETYRLVNRALRTQKWGRFNHSKEIIAALDEAIKAEEYAIGATTTKPRRSAENLWLKVAVPLLILVVIAAAVLLALQSGRDDENTAVSNTSPTLAAVAELNAQPTSSSTPTPLPPTTNLPIIDDVITTAPAPGQSFNQNQSITFAWTWPAPLANDQQFVVKAFSSGKELSIGLVTTSFDNTNYNLTIPATGLPLGTVEWQIQLVSASAESPITQSDKQTIMVMDDATGTPEPSATPTFTPEPSLTPTSTLPPQVRIRFSSASLRAGPSTRYDVIDYLFEDDVVTVLAISRIDGNWYNVITEDGIRGWLAISVGEQVGETAVSIVPIAATIPASPTPTPTNTPTNTPTPTPEPPTRPSTSGGGGGGGRRSTPKPTLTPPPPP